MPEKLSKAAVHYRVAFSDKRCGNCSMFRRAPDRSGVDSCTLVAGAIHNFDTCDRWERKLG